MAGLLFLGYHGALLVARGLGQDAAAGAIEALELEDARVVGGQVLHGVPRRGPEALQTPVALEPAARQQMVHCYFLHNMQKTLNEIKECILFFK